MQYSPHQLAYFAHQLTLKGAANSIDRMAGTLLDAQVDLNPHQIDAALFATSNPLSKGVMRALRPDSGGCKSIRISLPTSGTAASVAHVQPILAVPSRTGCRTFRAFRPVSVCNSH